jgi:C4-dicarboxylate-specific signal transduction histidine kinase
MLDRARYHGKGPDSPQPLMSDSPPCAELIEQLLNIARASALEEMASGIAHELNQPLGAIATFSQAGERMLARPEPMVKGAIEVLQQINQSAMGAGEGLRRIRRLFNRDHEERSRHVMSDVLTELKPVLELLAERAGARLVVTLDPDPPQVLIDHRQIQHVLFVLVQNALEACHSAGNPPVVRVETSTDGYTVQTAVIDNGSGIPAALRGEIFHPFFTTKSGGTGLGLASSRTVIESHQGSIGFDDAQGGGTRFWFRLPVANG